MPLESCMILLDNSEFMRNGDYVPTRLEAQQDAANLLVGAKIQSHPESTVGVSAGTDLLVSPSKDVGKLLSALHELRLSSAGGNISSDVTASVQVASLALKHRRNKNGGQRIILFVGTPLDGVEPRALAKAGRQLKKNNIAIDVVALGELEANEPKLRELVNAANGRSSDDDAGGERTCHLVTIPAGVLPSDVLASSPIVHGGEGGSAFAAAAAAGAARAGADMGGAFAEFGGVDPNMDPELAMALRVSMEEERARQERLAAQQAEANASGGNADAEMTDANSGGAAASVASAAAAVAADIGLSEEEALLQQALAMSMNEKDPGTGLGSGSADGDDDDDAAEDSKPAAADAMDMDDMDDEAAAMQMALQMSMQQNDDNVSDGNAASSSEEGKSAEFQDPQFVNELLGSLPGVNTNDPAIQNALRNLNNPDGAGKKDGNEKSEKEEDEDE